MSLRRSLLCTVFVAAFALTGCETLGLKPVSDTTPSQTASAPATASIAATAAPANEPSAISPTAPSASSNVADTTPSTDTIVGRQISQLRTDLNNLQTNVAGYNTTLTDLRNKDISLATSYYNIIGEINAKLQAGTTAGNPHLVQRWQDASAALDQLAATGNEMNALSSRIAASASMANYLLDATRATYSLSGAVDEDHVALKSLEDDVQRSVIGINRALTDLTHDLERQNAYVAAEHRNMQTLSLAVARGEVYGNSLANASAMLTPMASPQAMNPSMSMMPAPAVPVASETLLPRPGTLGQLPIQSTRAATPAPAAKTPFVIIRFDRSDVDYGQPLYQAMSQALSKNPMGSFDVVAVSPGGTGAKQAVAGTTARSKAEDVMRTMAEMGVPADRMQLTTTTSTDASTPEVHLFLR